MSKPKTRRDVTSAGATRVTEAELTARELDAVAAGNLRETPQGTPDAQEVQRWNFENGWPAKWGVSPLGSNGIQGS